MRIAGSRCSYKKVLKKKLNVVNLYIRIRNIFKYSTKYKMFSLEFSNLTNSFYVNEIYFHLVVLLKYTKRFTESFNSYEPININNIRDQIMFLICQIKKLYANVYAKKQLV